MRIVASRTRDRTRMNARPSLLRWGTFHATARPPVPGGSRSTAAAAPSTPGDAHLSLVEDTCARIRRCRGVGLRPLALLLAALMGCAPPAVERDGPAAALADTLAALIQEAYDFGRPGAAERMASLYAEGDAVLSASGGTLTVSSDSVRAGIAEFWEAAGRNMLNARWTWHEVYAERLGRDAAVLTGTWSLPHIAPGGHEHTIEGAWTAVFRRRSGEWKIVHEHLSTPAP
jgi:ketosteroid isomerase-like protein